MIRVAVDQFQGTKATIGHPLAPPLLLVMYKMSLFTDLAKFFLIQDEEQNVPLLM